MIYCVHVLYCIQSHDVTHIVTSTSDDFPMNRTIIIMLDRDKGTNKIPDLYTIAPVQPSSQ